MAEHTYTITVTQADIDVSVMKTDQWCPWTTAIVNQIPGALRAAVTAQDMRFTVGDERLTYATPPEVEMFLLAWDRGEHSDLKPVTITLANPYVSAVGKPANVTRRLTTRTEPPKGSAPRGSRRRIWGARVYVVNEDDQAALENDLAQYDRLASRSKKKPGALKTAS